MNIPILKSKFKNPFYSLKIHQEGQSLSTDNKFHEIWFKFVHETMRGVGCRSNPSELTIFFFKHDQRIMWKIYTKNIIGLSKLLRLKNGL